MPTPLKYLLLQMRQGNDPMRHHEVRCFARSLDCDEGRIEVFDLLGGAPRLSQLDRVDVVLLGGSGDYSVAEGGPWLQPALDAMRELHDMSKPTFASCWGFQAMARAMGGEVVTDLARAEVGTYALRLTESGRRDPVFGPLGDTFSAQIGHQDVVTSLPNGAVLLASSDLVENHAFRFEGRPIYCTQFHPELNRDTLLDRLRMYPTYIERIAGLTYDEFVEQRTGTPDTDGVLSRFVELVMNC